MDNEIKTGTINEEEFINIFGTKKQIESYNKGNRLSERTIVSIMKKAKCQCQIEEIETRKKGHEFFIRRIYEYPIPANLDSMKKSLYQYIIPLILHRVIQEQSHCVELTVGLWAKEIKMINNNYSIGILNQEHVANAITNSTVRCDEIDVLEFFRKTENYISYYIKQSLEYIAKSQMIDYYETYKIKYEYVETVTQPNGDIEYIETKDTHTMSMEEFKYYEYCIGVADKAAGINNDNERYYSKKSQKWHDVLRNELYKHNIVNVYKTYRIGTTNSKAKKCEALLKHFGRIKPETLERRLTNEFSNMIIENADNRYSKKEIELYLRMTEKQYHNLYFELCNMFIKPNDRELKSYMDSETVDLIMPGRKHKLIKKEK